jgi:hypothetical protein
MSDMDLQEPSQTLQGAYNVAPDQNYIEEGPGNGTLRDPTCPPQVTHPVSSTRYNGQNGGLARETPGVKRMKDAWRARWGILRSNMQTRNGVEDTSCQIAKPISRGIQWIGQGCLCRDKNEDESGDETSRQSIRLVQV